MSETYCVTVNCDAPSSLALDFLSDGKALGGWALGCFNTEPVGDDIVVGRSLDQGTPVYVRAKRHDQLGIITYDVGESPSDLIQWIWALVRPGVDLGYPDFTCVVSLIAWRFEGMSGQEWADLRSLHDAEIILIKGQIEQRAGSRGD